MFTAYIRGNVVSLIWRSLVATEVVLLIVSLGLKIDEEWARTLEVLDADG